MIREGSWLIVTTEEWKLRQTIGTRKSPSEKLVKDIKRATRKQYSPEEKIRFVLDGLRGEDSIAELCRREGISQGIYYEWLKVFMEANKKRLAGDTARAANTDEVKDLGREARDLKEVVAEQTLKLAPDVGHTGDFRGFPFVIVFVIRSLLHSKHLSKEI